MSLRLLEAPAGLLVSLERAKGQLRLQPEQVEDDELILALIAAVTSALDGPDGALQRALLTQKWALELDGFPAGRAALDPVTIPLPPLQSVEAVRYVDGSGVEQLLDPAVYIVHPGMGLLELAPSASFPATQRRRRAVTIEFTAGYGAADDVPPAITTAAAMMIADLYANPQAQVIGTAAAAVIENPTTRRLLASFHVRRV